VRDNKGEKVDLQGRVALVTGAGRGLGRAFAQALAGAGAAVAITARSEDQLNETMRLIEDAGGQVVAITADVSDQDAVEQVVATTEEQFGPIDLLVNNAGVGGPIVPAWEVDPGQWWRTIEINLRGPFLCTRVVLPSMIARKRGRIINVSSGLAVRPLPYLGAYSTSKAALTHWTNQLGMQTKEYGISVFAYAPGLVRTAMSERSTHSQEVHKTIRDRFQTMFAQGQDTSMERAVEMFMFLASGKADALSGRYIASRYDQDELLRRTDQIQKDDLFTPGMRTLENVF
jgi:NAD(P)-dependent dehydrogenase (short-subunit alcohol dehydrogenase family)